MRTRELLDRAGARLARAGLETPRLAAELLLAHAEGVDRAGLLARDDVEARGFDALLEAAERRVPLAYLTGRAWAYGLELGVGPGVFVPRACTDGLIERAIESLPRGGRACDVGTGSGAVALALAARRPDADVVAVDIATRALAFARRNARRHDARVRFVRGNLLDWTRARFDLIVSNPPYVESPADVAPEVLYEPPEALYGGLGVIRRLAADAPARLVPGGRLLLEFGFGQAEDVTRILDGVGAYRDIRIEPDLDGIPRFAGAVCRS
jgi:release factor glutamine methyltransferase